MNVIKIDNEAEFYSLMGMYLLKGYTYSGWIKTIEYRPIFGYVTVGRTFAVFSTEWTPIRGYNIIPFAKLKEADLQLQSYQL